MPIGSMGTHNVGEKKEKFLSSNVFVYIDLYIPVFVLPRCVQWFLEQNPSMTIDQLHQEAADQWRLSDLTDSGVECLPSRISTDKQCHIVAGFFPVQLHWLINITESPYDQLQRIHNRETDVGKEQQEFKAPTQYQSAAAKVKQKRALKLHLSDGYNTVVGLEYLPIPCLNTKLAPGIKVLLSGPMRCVNHVLLLEAKNVRILGGEIEAMATANAYENVLLRTLKQPLNPHPALDYKEENVIAGNCGAQSCAVAKPMRASEVALDDMDDDIFSRIDIDQIEAVAKRATTIQAAADDWNVLSEDDDAFLQIDDGTLHAASSTVSTATTAAAPAAATVIAVRTPIASTSSRISPVSRDDHRRSEPCDGRRACDPNYSFKLRRINLATIEQINACSDAEKIGAHYFIVKAEIDSITDSINVSENRWSMGVLISDRLSTDLLSVNLSDSVLEKLAEMSAREVYQLHEQKKIRPQCQHEIASVKIISTQKR